MMSQHYNFSRSILKKKQEGAALMIVMIFLILMTIVTVAATKTSILDVLVSGNDHQKILAYQEAENRLTQFTVTSELNKAYEADGFNNATQQFTTDEADANKAITDMSEKYSCERGGLGSSMGGAAPLCALYDFKILLNKKNTGTKEDHHRGAGKMVPNSGSKSSLI